MFLNRCLIWYWCCECLSHLDAVKLQLAVMYGLRLSVIYVHSMNMIMNTLSVPHERKKYNQSNIFIIFRIQVHVCHITIINLRISRVSFKMNN